MWPRPARPLCATEPQMRPQPLRTPSRWTILSEKDHDRPWPGVPHQACCFSDHGARRRQAWRKRDLRDSALLDLLTTVRLLSHPLRARSHAGRVCARIWALHRRPMVRREGGRLLHRLRTGAVVSGGSSRHALAHRQHSARRLCQLPWRRQRRERAGPRSRARDAGDRARSDLRRAVGMEARRHRLRRSFCEFHSGDRDFRHSLRGLRTHDLCAARRLADAWRGRRRCGLHGRRPGADRRRRAGRTPFRICRKSFRARPTRNSFS